MTIAADHPERWPSVAAEHVLRFRWWILLSWWTAWTVHIDGRMGDWSYMVSGARSLYSAAALHTYARDPALQIGPPAFALAGPLRLLSPHLATWIASAAMSAAALLVLRYVERSAGADARGAGRVLMAGLLLAPVWAEVVGDGHLDDVLVAGSACAAIAALENERWMPAAALIGLAAAAKPWGVGVLPLVLAVPAAHRRGAALLAVAVPVACWLPFVLGDSHTLARLASFHLGVETDSTWHLLGLQGTAPAWVRPAQFGTEIAGAVVAVRRCRHLAVPMVAFAARLLLDPQTVPYYSASLVLAAACYDVLRSHPRPLPVWTILTYLGLYEVSYLPPGWPLRAFIRAGVCLFLLGYICTGSRARRERPGDTVNLAGSLNV